MGVRQLRHGAGPVDRLHEVEGGADDLDISAGGDEPSVRNVGGAQRGEDPSLATHDVVAAPTLVDRWSAQHVAPLSTIEAHQDVLGSRRELLNVGDGTGFEAGASHPGVERREVDAVNPGEGALMPGSTRGHRRL
jgi:hypothetical protein